jgi:hypothetical protein
VRSEVWCRRNKRLFAEQLREMEVRIRGLAAILRPIFSL